MKKITLQLCALVGIIVVFAALAILFEKLFGVNLAFTAGWVASLIYYKCIDL